LGELRYDLAIIGGGPGGYAAALRAAELELSVAVIEKDKIGGTCLHRGCIPATGLLQSANVLETINRSEKFGIKTDGVSYDWKAVQKSKQDAVDRLFSGLNTLFKQRKVEIIKGAASLSEPGVVKVSTDGKESTVKTSNIIIATGSLPQAIPELEASPGIAMNTTQALEIDEVPGSVIIIGGGAYGVEFASLFRSFGSEVSVVEKAPRLIPRDDKDISRYLERAFKKRGIKTFTDAKVESVSNAGSGVGVEITKKGEKQTISAEKLLATVGRVANLEGIDVQALGIKLKDGFIETDSDMRTGVDGIFAVGDVTHNPQYANYAFQEGIHAVEIIAGLNPPPLNLKQIPIYTFGYPEIAKVGYSEEEAIQAGLDIETAGLPFQIVSRSAIDKEDIGFAKMVSVKGGSIIGIHLVGPGVVNLISEATLITNWEATAEDVGQFLHPHPTYTEAIGETAMKLAGKPLHSL